MCEVLIAPDLAVTASLPGGEAAGLALRAIAKAEREGRVWLYTGAVDWMASQLTIELSKTGTGPDAAHVDALARLTEFADGRNWLAALAEDGLFEMPSALIGQLQKAVGRLGDDAVLLTGQADWRQDIKQALTPAEYLNREEIAHPLEFIDIKTQQDVIRPTLENRLSRVLRHGRYIMGPEIAELEARLADYVGVQHCITVASGTDSLLIAMMALGIGPGDEVITVPYTWIATAEMIVLLGARTVFVDIDARTFNMDPELIEPAITPRTKAIMPVGIYGQCADMDAITALAAKYGLPVIEDGAQSFGATYKGRRSCSLSTIGSTSFFPSKPLGCYGDGGALFTDDDNLAERMRQIRVHGQQRKHHHPLLGLNGRLDTLQAAVLLSKLERFETECRDRKRVAARYTYLIEAAQSNEEIAVSPPYVPEENKSVFAQYTVLVDGRDDVQTTLAAGGIPTVGYYAVPLHLQPVFRGLGHNIGAFPVAEDVARRCLSLPMSPYLSEAIQSRIISRLLKTMSGHASSVAQ